MPILLKVFKKNCRGRNASNSLHKATIMIAKPDKDNTQKRNL